MLPNLRSMGRLRCTVTPDLQSKRSTTKLDDSNPQVLRKQVEYLQKQLEHCQQNSSFVMRITSQQCVQCPKLRDQLEQNAKTDKINRKKLEQKIEELLKQPKQIKTIREPQIDPRYDILLKQIKLVQFSDVFPSEDPSQLEFITVQAKQQMEINQQNLQDQLLNAKQQILKTQQEYSQLLTVNEALRIQLRNQQKEYEILKAQHSGCTSEIIDLKLKLSVSFNKSKEYQLPDDIRSLKRTIDSTIELNKVQELMISNQDLHKQLIKQNTTIDHKANSTQVNRHLIKIETLETELYLSLRCCRCMDLLSKPITYIPCGHSCCQKCFKKKCEKCETTEAVYRNIQFDELIKIYQIVKETKDFIKGCLLQF